MKTLNTHKKQGATVITRGIVYLMGIAVLSICGILLPELAREEAISNPNAGAAYPFLIGAWVLSIPIFIALYQALKLIEYMDNGTAFSKKSIKALQNIKICTLIFSFMIVASATTIVFVAKSIDPREDVTPVITFGFIFTFTSLVIATFIAVLQKLLHEAINIKSENDLTI